MTPHSSGGWFRRAGDLWPSIIISSSLILLWTLRPGSGFLCIGWGPFIGLWSVGSLAETHHKSVIRPGEPSLTRASRMSTGLSSVLESLIKLGRNPPGNGLGHKAGPALLEDWQTSLVLPLLQFMLISPIAISDNFLYLVEVPFLQRYFIRIFVIFSLKNLKPLLY